MSGQQKIYDAEFYEESYPEYLLGCGFSHETACLISAIAYGATLDERELSEENNLARLLGVQ